MTPTPCPLRVSARRTLRAAELRREIESLRREAAERIDVKRAELRRIERRAGSAKEEK